MKHSRSTALFFSLIPGAGHMYLGLAKQGIQLMLLFFFTWFIGSSYDFRFLYIFIPIIWFYSIFDVRKKSLYDGELVDEDLPIFTNKDFVNNLKDQYSVEKYIAYALILMGIFSLADNLIFPILERYVLQYEIISYIKSFITSAILIAIGIFLIKRKTPKIKSGDEKCSKEE